MRFNYLAAKSWGIRLATALALLTLFCTFTYAENQSQSASKELEAWQQALLYSKDHPVITFALYGRTNDATALQNAEKIKAYFAEHEIQSKYYLGKENRMGSSVALFIQGVPYGPTALSKATSLIQQVITHYKEEYPSS